MVTSIAFPLLQAGVPQRRKSYYESHMRFTVRYAQQADELGLTNERLHLITAVMGVEAQELRRSCIEVLDVAGRIDDHRGIRQRVRDRPEAAHAAEDLTVAGARRSNGAKQALRDCLPAIELVLGPAQGPHRPGRQSRPFAVLDCRPEQRACRDAPAG